MKVVNAIKCTYSTLLLLFSIAVIVGLMFTEETRVSHDVHPIAAIVIMTLALVWLNMVEGGQGALVGLPPVDRDLYIETHPLTNKCTEWCHKGDNLDRYLMGRQFMVLMIVFVTNLCGAPLSDAIVFGLPDVVTQIFLKYGLAMILVTTMAGQLNSQVNTSHCMLDYINNRFAYFTLAVAMMIEHSGLLHTCYLVKIIVAKVTGNPIESREAPRDSRQNFFFWTRVVVSVIVLLFAFAVTLTALFEGKTTMWSGVPNGVAVILFFIFMCIVGLLEGMQIAFFAVAKKLAVERGDHPMARKTCELLFRGDGRNLPSFMIGRQVCVTMCFFIIARVTTIDVDISRDDNIFGVPDNMQRFFNTGQLGALITTIVASISWQLVASSVPVAFLSNPMVYLFLRICLMLEATGVCSGAWVLAAIHRKIAGFQQDKSYIGTPEERAASFMPDSESIANIHLGTFMLVEAPGASNVSSQHHLKPQQRQSVTEGSLSDDPEYGGSGTNKNKKLKKDADGAGSSKTTKSTGSESDEAEGDEESGLRK